MIKSIIKNIRYKLEPTEYQSRRLEEYCRACNSLWNILLRDRIDIYKEAGKYAIKNWMDQCKMLPILKIKYPWLKSVPSMALVDVSEKLGLAYDAFFRRIKSGEVGGFPKFKNKKNKLSFKLSGKATFTVHANGLHIQHPNSIKRKYDIGRIKTYEIEKIFDNKNILPKEVVISKNNIGEWFATFACEITIDKSQTNSNKIGLDVGIANDITTSNGDVLKVYKKSKQDENYIKKLKRQLSKKKISGKNYNKLKMKLAKTIHKHDEKKKYELHRLTTKLVKENSTICIENLNISGMTKSAKGNINEPGKNVKTKSGLNREILNRNWGIIFSHLEYKLKINDGTLIKVNPAYTSQTCSQCGFCHKDNRTSQENFCCKQCGFIYNADKNAAINILHLGLKNHLSAGMLPVEDSQKESKVSGEVSSEGLLRNTDSKKSEILEKSC